jgi:hypothetical protein
MPADSKDEVPILRSTYLLWFCVIVMTRSFLLQCFLIVTSLPLPLFNFDLPRRLGAMADAFGHD